MLDALNLYLGCKNNCYNLSNSSPAWRAETGMVVSKSDKKISVRRRKDKYIITGFPEEADWLDFKKEVRDLVGRVRIENDWDREIILESETKFWERQKNGKV